MRKEQTVLQRARERERANRARDRERHALADEPGVRPPERTESQGPTSMSALAIRPELLGEERD